MQGAVIRIIVLHNLLCSLLNLIAQIAESLRHVVVNALNGFASLAAAIRQLSGRSISVLHSGDVALIDRRDNAVCSVRNVRIDTVHLSELVIPKTRNAILNAVEHHLSRLLSKTVLNFSAGGRSAAAIAAIKAATEARTTAITKTTPAKQSHNDDPGPPVAAIAVTVTAVAICDCRNISHARSIITREHNIPPNEIRF